MNNSKSKKYFSILCLAFLIALPVKPGRALSPSPAITLPASPQPEGTDFATLVLRDPWDMSELTDISQYLNEAGQRNLVKNINVADGLFTGTSVGDAITGNAYFFPLFPGYEGTIHAGKLGSRYPIPFSTNKCLHIAMKVDSGIANSFGPDQYRIFWFADERLTNGPWGVTNGIALYPEAGAGQPVQGWRLYNIDLATTPSIGTAWNSMPSVEGLRIDPTINKDIDFAVDWIRLTDCSAVNVNLTWTSGTSSDTAIWLRPVGTSRDIRVATGIVGTSGSYALDIQGITPGSYYVGLGTGTTCCSQMNTSQPLVINQTPVATFVRPSFISGADYASQAGDNWDFSDITDVSEFRNFESTSFQFGELNLVTPSGPQPAGVDAQIVLNSPLPADLANFRYLNFRMSTQNGSALWENCVDGGMARFVWSVQGASGLPGFRCNIVSHDIPYDVGFQTYSIDLFDSFNGLPEMIQGDCTGIPTSWEFSGPGLQFRFDPNENITCNPQTGSPFIISTCGDYVQKLDWIRLTEIDQASQGAPFPILISLNHSPADVSLDFFYTTTTEVPTQNNAQLYTPQIPEGNYQLYLPLLLSNYPTSDTIPTANVSFQWDTKNVVPGTYYICVQANDTINTATYCSEAPMKVVGP